MADVASKDVESMEVAALYRDDPAFNVQKLVDELVKAESVPLLPVLRYKDTGLRKRAEWERTWDLQRQEDKLAEKNEDLGTWNLELSKDNSDDSSLSTKSLSG